MKEIKLDISVNEEIEADTEDLLCMKRLYENLFDLYQRKNHDYGNSFDKSIDKRGLVAAVVRMEDKFNRFDNLVTNSINPCVDESIIETCLDLANYSVMVAKYLIIKNDIKV